MEDIPCGGLMLSSASGIAFLPSSDLDRSRRFFADTLGRPFLLADYDAAAVPVVLGCQQSTMRIHGRQVRRYRRTASTRRLSPSETGRSSFAKMLATCFSTTLA